MRVREAAQAVTNGMNKPLPSFLEINNLRAELHAAGFGPAAMTLAEYDRQTRGQRDRRDRESLLTHYAGEFYSRMGKTTDIVAVTYPQAGQSASTTKIGVLIYNGPGSEKKAYRGSVSLRAHADGIIESDPLVGMLYPIEEAPVERPRAAMQDSTELSANAPSTTPQQVLRQQLLTVFSRNGDPYREEWIGWRNLEAAKSAHYVFLPAVMDDLPLDQILIVYAWAKAGEGMRERALKEAGGIARKKDGIICQCSLQEYMSRSANAAALTDYLGAYGQPRRAQGFEVGPAAVSKAAHG
jgi:hypothetical protein